MLTCSAFDLLSPKSRRQLEATNSNITHYIAPRVRTEEASPLPKLSKSVLETIGNTPMVELTKLNTNPLARVFVKMEYCNPSGSIKDRIAKHIIERFEASGRLRPGGVIVENSSGNTAAR